MDAASDCCRWPLPPNHLTLKANDVHVWCAPLDPSDAVFQELRNLLARDESEKASRFYFETDRRHFTVAHGFLRKLLGDYLGIAPQDIRFSQSEYGKPSLVESINHLDLSFNLAHSGKLVLYALTLNRRIGVDLEYVRPEFTTNEIARRYFSPLEVAELDKLPANLRHHAFFTCWTRKEAFIKAMGIGLSLPLDQFDVTIHPAEPAALLHTHWNHEEASRWSLQTLDAGPGYAAAVASEGHEWQLSTWSLQ